MIQAESPLQELYDNFARRQSRTVLFSAVATLIPIISMIACIVIVSAHIRTVQRTLVTTQADVQRLQTLRAQLEVELEDKSGALRALNDALAAADLQRQKVEAAAASTANPSATLALVRELASDSAKTPREQAQDLWSKGYAAYNAGKVEDAQRYYEQSRDVDPTFAAPLNSLGRLAGDRGDAATSERDFREALARQSDYVPALYNLARLEFQLKHYDEAEHLSRKTLRIKPDFAPAQRLLQQIDAVRQSPAE